MVEKSSKTVFYLWKNLITTVISLQINDIFALFVIKFDKLGSTYESNMENAVLVPHLIIIGSARQQHDVWIGP